MTLAEDTARPARREQILDAAAGLFATHGYHGVGIDDIGAAVGISGPALYRHFRSKDAMLSEMLTAISDRLWAGGQQRRAAEDPLRELIAFHVDFALDNPALIVVQERNLAHLTESDRKRVRAQQRRYVELWVEAIRATIPETGELTARAAAHAVFGLINSTPHSRLLGRGRMAELLTAMALGAIESLAAGD
ncbi:TetR family transcriptional regulator [Sciscionella marina]|uniref:SACE_7040 family transcriptional regulator n=1 Tax=Sciscionella marina TaxID=508770 RepID=UPI000366E96D